jgi:transposase-like protein
MHIGRFGRLLSRVERDLTADQHVALRARLERIEGARATEIAIETRARELGRSRACPRCGAGGAVKHGRDKLGRQRFLCRRTAGGGCGRSFNTLTGTPFARMRKPAKWHAFATALARGFVSVDRLAAQGLGLSRLTIWRWRNRFLQAQARRQAATLGGVIEADETYFRTSYKGSRGWVRGRPPENRPPRYRGAPAIKRGLSKEQVAVLTAIDNRDNIIETKITGLAEIRPLLKGRIARGSVVCSDGARSYVWVALDAASEHRRIWIPLRKSKARKLRGGKPRRRGCLGLGRVNAQHARMKGFVNHQARGASTGNLPTYLGWLRALRRPDFNPTSLLRDALLAA